MTDRDADRLIHLVKQDETARSTTEDLLLALAADFASAPHADEMTACSGLRAALQDAAELKALGMLSQNPTDPIMSVLRRLSDLNDRGLRDEAGREVDRALTALDATQALQKSALTEIGVRQDRVRNSPEAAAKRQLALLRGQAHPGGLFRALHDAWEVWFDRGHEQGQTFDLNVALALARANLERSKGIQRVQAMADLGITQFRLGEREGRADRLKQSIATFRAFLAEVPRKQDPDTWAVGMVNLGLALQALAAHDPAHLTEAAACMQKALLVQTATHAPEDHAATSAHLGLVTAALAARQV